MRFMQFTQSYVFIALSSHDVTEVKSDVKSRKMIIASAQVWTIFILNIPHQGIIAIPHFL